MPDRAEQYPTPDPLERVLTSERLSRVETELRDANRRLTSVEGELKITNDLLERLVKLAEAKDQRDTHLAAESAAWFRSILSKEVLLPIVTAIAGVLAGWGGTHL